MTTPHRERPASIIIFGGLNLAFGAYSVFGLVMCAALVFAPHTTRNPITDHGAAYRTWRILSSLLAVAGTAALITSGVGLLKFKPWARKLAIAYSIFAIVTGIIGSIASFYSIIRPALERNTRTTLLATTIVVTTQVMALIHPILLLIFMNRRNVINGLCRPGLPPPMPAPRPISAPL